MLDALGINIPILLAQLAAFLILFLLLSKFAFPKLTKTLDERAARIKGAMEHAETVKQQTLQAEERMKMHLVEARQEGQKMLAQAEQVGERLKEEAKVEARKEAEAIIVKAQAEIKVEREQAISELRKEVVDLAILAAEKVVKESLNESSHRKLIDEVIKNSGVFGKG